MLLYGQHKPHTVLAGFLRTSLIHPPALIPSLMVVTRHINSVSRLCSTTSSCSVNALHSTASRGQSTGVKGQDIGVKVQSTKVKGAKFVAC